VTALTAATRVGRPNRGQRLVRNPYLLLLPALIPVLVLSVLPLIQGIYLGFTDAEAGLNVTTNFNGIANYIRLLDNELYWSSFRIGLVWAFSTTFLQLVLGLTLAILLNEPLRFKAVVRTLVLVPWAMPPVIVAILWNLVYQPDAGLLNELLRSVGLIDRGISWLADFNTALLAVIVVGVWAGMATVTISLLAGLQNIPAELYEAASVDAAGPVQRFRHITWPQLLPVTEAIVALNFIWNFNSFGIVYVLTKGGPGTTTMLPPLFAYNEGFRYGHFGYAAAMGNVMVLVIVGLLAVYAIYRRRHGVT
jgi:multiple sugar transport system permease protein